MSKVTDFIRESREEIKKVNWPSRQQIINYTLVVVAASLVVAIFLGSLDLGFSKIVERFIIQQS